MTLQWPRASPSRCGSRRRAHPAGPSAQSPCAAAFPAASGTDGAITNDQDITFATAGGAWGNVSHVAIFDAATGGNLLVYGALASAVDIQNGDIFKIPSGSFTCNIRHIPSTNSGA